MSSRESRRKRLRLLERKTPDNRYVDGVSIFWRNKYGVTHERDQRGLPLCGTVRKRGAYQLDLGVITCLRCLGKE